MDEPTNVIGRRVGGFLIDGVIVTALFAGLFFVFATKVDRSAFTATGAQEHVTLGHTVYVVSGQRLSWLFLGEVAVGFLYYALLPGSAGWTVGKLLLGIRVVSPDGRIAGVGKNTLRWLVLIVDDFPYILPGLTGLIIALASGKKRRLGDMAAGTYVVRKDAVGRPVPAPGAGSAVIGGRPEQPARAAPQAATGAAPHVHAGYAAPVVPSAPPASWYPDPDDPARLRWWDGSHWTEHVDGRDPGGAPPPPGRG